MGIKGTLKATITVLCIVSHRVKVCSHKLTDIRDSNIRRYGMFTYILQCFSRIGSLSRSSKRIHFFCENLFNSNSNNFIFPVRELYFVGKPGQ